MIIIHCGAESIADARMLVRVCTSTHFMNL